MLYNKTAIRALGHSAVNTNVGVMTISPVFKIASGDLDLYGGVRNPLPFYFFQNDG